MVWYRRGEYWYRTPRGSAPAYEVRHCAQVACGELFFGRRSVRPGQGRFCSVRCSRLGVRAAEVGYRGAHHRVERARGKAFKCEITGCATGGQRFHWANLTGRLGDTGDYLSMCVFHHRAYDWALILGMGAEEALQRVSAIPDVTQRMRSAARKAL